MFSSKKSESSLLLLIAIGLIGLIIWSLTQQNSPIQIHPNSCLGSSSQSCTIGTCSGVQTRTCSNGVWSSWGICTKTDSNCGIQGCTPSCLGKNCGSDGCGGSCGTCQSGYTCSNNRCISQPIGSSHFEYPSEKKNGYYTVPLSYCPNDKCQYCMYEGGSGACGGLLDTRNLFTINQGYIESYTFDSNLPIYGAYDMYTITNFNNKCFVGDCNKNNKRHTICINNGELQVETTSCNKWVTTYSFSYTLFCVKGKTYTLGYTTQINNCHKPKIINFYYIYNDYQGYEGYSSDWKQRWAKNLEYTNNILKEYGIQFNANYYEYKLSNSNSIPSTIIYSAPDSIIMPGDIHISIFAGKKNPFDYGLSCPGTNINPCEASSGLGNGIMEQGGTIRIPDYYDTDGRGKVTLIHELGHSLGCPHTGDIGSLTAHLYMNDIMSYGNGLLEGNIFRYECRLALWLLGQNG